MVKNQNDLLFCESNLSVKKTIVKLKTNCYHLAYVNHNFEKFTRQNPISYLDLAIAFWVKLAKKLLVTGKSELVLYTKYEYLIS